MCWILTTFWILVFTCFNIEMLFFFIIWLIWWNFSISSFFLLNPNTFNEKSYICTHSGPHEPPLFWRGARGRERYCLIVMFIVYNPFGLNRLKTFFYVFYRFGVDSEKKWKPIFFLQNNYQFCLEWAIYIVAIYYARAQKKATRTGAPSGTREDPAHTFQTCDYA